jgi:hypothetical protein
MSGSKFVCIECHLNTHAMSLDRYGCEAGIDQVRVIPIESAIFKAGALAHSRHGGLTAARGSPTARP